MKRLLAAAALALSLASGAHASYLLDPQSVADRAPSAADFNERFAQFGAGVQNTPGVASPQAIGGPVDSPTYVMPPNGGVIDIGQALGPFLQPYVDAAVQALLAALVSWVLLVVKKKVNVSIDEGHRDALITALQNQAGSLIADGFVKLDGAKIAVPNQQLAQAANEVLKVIPDAAKHLGLTPDYVAKRIVDMIPQTAAGAAIVAAAQPVQTPQPAAAAPPQPQAPQPVKATG